MTLTTAAIVLHTASDAIKLALTGQIIDRHMARMSAQMGGRVIPLLADDSQYLRKKAHLWLIEVEAKEPEVDNLGN